jgi:hypothetical protein
MSQTRYHFRNAVSAFFEMPTDSARKLIPEPLEPMEVRHGSAIFAITVFDFTESMVGPYQEVVLAVIVPPLVQPGGQFPRSAFYPFLLGTSTPESRRHAIERWHLPHHMGDVQVSFEEKQGRMTIGVTDAGKPVIDLSIASHDWSEVDHLYQSFMRDNETRFKVDIHMQGRFCEHEEEAGRITFHDHPLCAQLDPREVAATPFRELWMQNGVQTFEELETL